MCVAYKFSSWLQQRDVCECTCVCLTQWLCVSVEGCFQRYCAGSTAAWAVLLPIETYPYRVPWFDLPTFYSQAQKWGCTHRTSVNTQVADANDAFLHVGNALGPSQTAKAITASMPFLLLLGPCGVLRRGAGHTSLCCICVPLLRSAGSAVPRAFACFFVVLHRQPPCLLGRALVYPGALTLLLLSIDSFALASACVLPWGRHSLCCGCLSAMLASATKCLLPSRHRVQGQNINPHPQSSTLLPVLPVCCSGF